MKIYLYSLIILFAFGCGNKKNHEDSTPLPSEAYGPIQNFNDTVSESVDDTVPKPVWANTRFTPALRSDVEKIAQGVQKGLALCNCYQTRSLDFEAVNAVACEIVGGPIAVGVWAMGHNAGIYSVGYPTATISDWGKRPDVSLEDDGFQEVLDFVRDLPPCE